MPVQRQFSIFIGFVKNVDSASAWIVSKAKSLRRNSKVSSFQIESFHLDLFQLCPSPSNGWFSRHRAAILMQRSRGKITPRDSHTLFITESGQFSSF